MELIHKRRTECLRKELADESALGATGTRATRASTESQSNRQPTIDPSTAAATTTSASGANAHAGTSGAAAAASASTNKAGDRVTLRNLHSNFQLG